METHRRDDCAYLQEGERNGGAEDNLYEKMPTERARRDTMAVLFLIVEGLVVGLAVRVEPQTLERVAQRMQYGCEHPSGQEDGQQKKCSMSDSFLHAGSSTRCRLAVRLSDRRATSLFRRRACAKRKNRCVGRSGCPSAV